MTDGVILTHFTDAKSYDVLNIYLESLDSTYWHVFLNVGGFDRCNNLFLWRSYYKIYKATCIFWQMVMYNVSVAIEQRFNVLQLVCREIILDICGCKLDNIFVVIDENGEIGMWWYW